MIDKFLLLFKSGVFKLVFMSFLVVESVTESQWDGSFESQRLLKQRKKTLKTVVQKRLIWTEEPWKQLVGKFSLFVNIAMARFSYITSVTVFFKTKVHFLVLLRGTLLFFIFISEGIK